VSFHTVLSDLFREPPRKVILPIWQFLQPVGNPKNCAAPTERIQYVARHRASTNTRWHFAFGAVLS